MTIKDVERQTGITKANIRFYEAQGLIQPGRTDSGYRSYCPEDVEELKRVRLLRLLDVPMEQVKALQQGKASLDGVLAGQLVQIQEEKKRLSDVTQVIRQIRQNGEEYPSLEPEPYLERLKGRETEDALISDRHPWRRYWARTLDSGLIGVWMLAAFPGALEGGGKLFQMQFLALSLAAQILLEPLLLWAVGWTPGKLLLGIRVTGREETYFPPGCGPNIWRTDIWPGFLRSHTQGDTGLCLLEKGGGRGTAPLGTGFQTGFQKAFCLALCTGSADVFGNGTVCAVDCIGAVVWRYAGKITGQSIRKTDKNLGSPTGGCPLSL